MIAQLCDLEPGEFIWTGGDCHLYLNHLDQARLQITRVPLELPTLRLDRSITSIDDFTYESIELVDYIHHDAIKGEISV